MKTTKMVRLARVLEAVFTALMILLAVGTVLLAVFAAVMLLKPQELQAALILGPAHLTFREGIFTSETKTELLLTLLTLLLTLPLLFAALWTLKAIFRPISLEQPFDHAGKLIRRLAWLELAGGLLSFTGSLVAQTWIFRTYGLNQLLLNDSIQSVSLNLDGSFNFILYFAVLVLLSWVFDYGKELQQLSDETL